MNIDLPTDSAEAYKIGWNDLLDMQITQFLGIRDNFLNPRNSEDKHELESLNRTIHLLSEYRDIQAKLAQAVEHESKKAQRVKHRDPYMTDPYTGESVAKLNANDGPWTADDHNQD